MSVLGDATLATLYPEYRGVVGPASIDLAIGDTLLYWPDYITRDPRTDQGERWKSAPFESRDGAVWVLEPGTRYLATTRDRIGIPDDCAGLIAARSSWGRDGLAVICGPAGFLDPGYRGRPTLELSVIGSYLVFWPGAVVCQLILHRLDRPCERPYRGKYMDDDAPTPSRLWTEATKDADRRAGTHYGECSGCGSAADAARIRGSVATGFGLPALDALP